MKRFFSLSITLLSCLFVLSCGGNKEQGGTAGTATLGVEIQNAQELYELPQNQTTTLNAAVVANPTSAEVYTITLGVKPSLVEAYNTQKGTDYEVLPADHYTFVSSQVILTRYGAKSSNAQLRLGGGSAVVGKTYVLPVVIESVQGGVNFDAPDSKAAFVLVKITSKSLDGQGTASAPYLIKSVGDFLAAGSVLRENQTTYFRLENDVDFEGAFSVDNPWKPINPETEGLGEGEPDPAFTRKAVFDGNNKKISNFKTGGPLFAILVGSAKDLTFENVDITTDRSNWGGVLAGYADAPDGKTGVVAKNISVKNAKMDDAYKRTGGLIGYMVNGTVEDVDVECAIKGGESMAGGIIGRTEDGILRNCSFSGSVSVGSYQIGGLVGYAVNVAISDSHAAASLKGLGNNTYFRGGGLVGHIEGSASIEKCYATGDVVAETKGHMAGGLIGSIGGSESNTVNIKKSYASVNVTLPESGNNFAHAGGLVGTLASAGTLTIENCYATGKITATRWSSGFVGSIYDHPGKLIIKNGYSTCDLSGMRKASVGIVLGLTYAGKSDVDPVIPPATVSCQGFVAWNVSDKPFCYPEDAVNQTNNYYGTAGTVSQQASALHWDTAIWDLSGNLPVLK